MAIDGSKEKTSLRPSIDTSILPYRPQSFTYDQVHYTSGGAPVQKQGFAPHGGRTQQIAGCRSFFCVSLRTGENSAADIRKKEPTTNGRVVFAVRNQSYRLIALPLASGGYLLCILHKGVHIYITIFVQYMCTFIVEICVHI